MDVHAVDPDSSHLEQGVQRPQRRGERPGHERDVVLPAGDGVHLVDPHRDSPRVSHPDGRGDAVGQRPRRARGQEIRDRGIDRLRRVGEAEPERVAVQRGDGDPGLVGQKAAQVPEQIRASDGGPGERNVRQRPGDPREVPLERGEVVPAGSPGGSRESPREGAIELRFIPELERLDPCAPDPRHERPRLSSRHRGAVGLEVDPQDQPGVQGCGQRVGDRDPPAGQVVGHAGRHGQPRDGPPRGVGGDAADPQLRPRAVRQVPDQLEEYGIQVCWVVAGVVGDRPVLERQPDEPGGDGPDGEGAADRDQRRGFAGPHGRAGRRRQRQERGRAGEVGQNRA